MEPVKAKVIEKGPLYVEGPIVVETPDGKSVKKEKCYFCRCTRSKNQPWCDGSHAKQP